MRDVVETGYRWNYDKCEKEDCLLSLVRIKVWHIIICVEHVLITESSVSMKGRLEEVYTLGGPNI